MTDHQTSIRITLHNTYPSAMDSSEVLEMVEDLSGNIDDLETSLEPFLTSRLNVSTSRIPLLDKAKLHVLAAYAIESIIFSYLRLNGVDAKEHAVFRELTRVKEYFAKIKSAEAGPAQRNTTLDKDAAARFIRQGLSGNAAYDRERREREQIIGKRKADEMRQTSQWGSHNRFQGAAKRMRAQDDTTTTIAQAAEVEDPVEDDVDAGTAQPVATKADKKAAKRQRRLEAKAAKQSPVSNAQSPAEEDEDVEDASNVPHAIPGNTQSNLHDAVDAHPHHESKKKKKRGRKTRSEQRKSLEDKRAQEMA